MSPEKHPENPQVGEIYVERDSMSRTNTMYRWTGSNWVIVGKKSDFELLAGVDFLPTNMSRIDQGIDQGLDQTFSYKTLPPQNLLLNELQYFFRKENKILQKDSVWIIIPFGTSSLICPICGAMVPQFGVANKEGRTPQQQHEYWHKTVNCDWYIEEEDDETEEEKLDD